MDLDQFRQLDREEEKELVLRGQAGDVEARNTVVMGVSKMAWGMAWKHSGRNHSRAHELFDEIIAVLCDKFHVFDASMGNRFSTWAGFWMYQVCMRYRQTNGRTIRIPCHLQTSDGLEKEDYRQQYIDRAKRITSLDAVIPGTDFQPHAEDWKESQPVDAVELRDRQEFVQLVLTKLSPRNRQVMERFCQDLTLEEKSVEMGVSRERVRQLEIKAIRQFLAHAERINKPLMREIEQDICSSNRFQGIFQKARKQKMSSEQAKSKKEKLREVIQKLGQGAKGRDIKAALAGEPFKVHDCDISVARRAIWGPPASSNGHLPKVQQPRKTQPSHMQVELSLEVLKSVKAFAGSVGGISRLHELTTFLAELAA